ncbi:hypothetical protein D3C86_1856280 [compost metagenome]
MHRCIFEGMGLPNAAGRGIKHVACFHGEFLSVYVIVGFPFNDEGKIMEIDGAPANLPIREGSAVNEQKDLRHKMLIFVNVHS